MKMFFRKYIFESFDQRLFVRRVPRQPVAADLIGLQIHFGAHQPVNPQPIHLPTMAQHPDCPRVIRPAQVNDRAAWTSLQIQLPTLRKGPSCWRPVVAHGSALLVGRHKPVARRLEGQRVGVVEALPDFLLPQMVETFIEILRPVFPWRGKDRRDPPRDRQKRMTCPNTSECVCVPWKRESLSNWAYAGVPCCRQRVSSRSQSQRARRAALPHAPHADPQSARVVSTSSLGPASSGRSSMTSKASSSIVPSATSGRYQPAGGAARHPKPHAL